MEYFPHPHTSEKIADKLKSIFDEYEISEKIGSVTTDNAPNMKAGIRELNNKISSIQDGSISVEHIPCSAHSLNLIVKTGLDRLTDENGKCQKIIEKLRKLIKKIRKSSFLRQILKERAKTFSEPECLKLDIDIRWNSTFDMIKRANQMKSSVNSMSSIIIFFS